MSAQSPQLLLVVDLEATCWPPGSPERAQQRQLAEVIELGAVLIKPLTPNTGEPPATFESLVRPERRPELDPFCAELTGLDTESLRRAPKLAETLERLWAWVEEESEQSRARWALTLASWGPFDHGILKRQASELELCLPRWEHLDVKRAFERWCRRHRREGSRFGLRRALSELGLPHEGPAHRALSDALAAWRILDYIRHPQQLTPLASALISSLVERESLTPASGLRWSKELTQPLSHKSSFERAASELLDAQLIRQLEHGKGYTLSERGALLKALITSLPTA